MGWRGREGDDLRHRKGETEQIGQTRVLGVLGVHMVGCEEGEWAYEGGCARASADRRCRRERRQVKQEYDVERLGRDGWLHKEEWIGQDRGSSGMAPGCGVIARSQHLMLVED